MRKLGFVFVAVLLLSTASASYGQGGGTVRIADIQPLSGASGQYGQQSVNGAEVAQEIINAHGGILGKKIELVNADDASDKTQTAALMRKYGPDTTFLAIIGPTFSSDFVATAPLAAQFKVVYISAGSTAPWPGEFNDWTFRSSVPGNAFLPTLVKEIVAKAKPRSAAQIWAIDNQALAVQGKLLDTLFPQTGIKVTVDETARNNDTDYSAQIARIMQSPPDIIAIGLITNDAALFMQQARSAGYKGLFMANGSTLLDPSLYALSHGAANGLLVGSPFDPTEKSPIVQEFDKAFQAKFNRLPTSQDAFGYDALALLADAAKRAGTISDRQKLRDALGSTKGFRGVTGSFTFDGKGDNTTPTIHVLKLTAKGFVSY